MIVKIYRVGIAFFRWY